MVSPKHKRRRREQTLMVTSPGSVSLKGEILKTPSMSIIIKSGEVPSI